MDDEYDAKIKLAVEQAKLAGVSCTTVDDGHVLIFTKDKLQELITAAESTSREMVIVLVKRSDMASLTPRITH